MKALILTGNTGEGHNQTAKAIIDEFKKAGHECVAVDSLSFLSEKKSKFICNWHLRLYRHLPKTSSLGYSMIDRNPKPLEKPGKCFFKFFAKGADKLNQLITENGYELVISVHPFSNVIIAGYQLKYKDSKVKTAFIPTDYTCSPGAASGNIDTYFIPHPDLSEAFIKRGVAAEKLYPVFGIPLKKEFYSAPTKAEAKKHLGLSENQKSVLLTCGSMGCGPMTKLTKKLAKVLPPSVKLFVICGTNKPLYKKLKNKGFPKNIEIIGYTNEMLYYLASCDVYITKPGGISSTEAATLGVPTLLINAVGGCETYNCNFFVEHGSAKTAKKLNEFVNLTISLLEDSSEIEKSAKKIKDDFSSQSSAQSIVSYYFKEEPQKNEND